MKNLITILIPCYNSSKLLNKLFNILDNQTNQNFDVIFVDDFSSDNTKVLLQEYIKKHPNYKLIANEKNYGISTNRNILISNVSTKYFMFLDDDDFLKPKAIETLYKQIGKDDNFEILTFGAGYKYQGKNIKVTFRNNIPFFRRKNNKNIEEFICNNLITSWSHLFKTEFIKKINHGFLDNYVLSEDFGTVPIWLLSCNEWKYISTSLIIYIFRATRTNNVSRPHNSIDWIKKCYESNKNQMMHCLNALHLIQDKYKDNKKLLNRLATWFFIYVPPKKKWLQYQNEIIPIISDMLAFIKSKGLKLVKPNGIAYRVLFNNIKKTIMTTDSLKQYTGLIKK